ncbi:hypothetical protein TNCV_393041 [Trichonephila clavipes]|nr:hypothetical protein TNCV_393041 [Trichonephila clavipes]
MEDSSDSPGIIGRHQVVPFPSRRIESSKQLLVGFCLSVGSLRRETKQSLAGKGSEQKVKRQFTARFAVYQSDLDYPKNSCRLRSTTDWKDKAAVRLAITTPHSLASTIRHVICT